MNNIIKNAKNIVQQWEEHDQYRQSLGDDALFDDGIRPNEVAISKLLLVAVRTMRLTRDQYLGCGGRLSDAEILKEMHRLLDIFLTEVDE